jgi:hypothetical protein
MISTSTESSGSDYEMNTSHWGQELAHETSEKTRVHANGGEQQGRADAAQAAELPAAEPGLPAPAKRRRLVA